MSIPGMSLSRLGGLTRIVKISAGDEIVDTHGRGVVDVYICSLTTPQFCLFVTSSPKNPRVPLGISVHHAVSTMDIPDSEVVFNKSEKLSE